MNSENFREQVNANRILRCEQPRDSALAIKRQTSKRGISNIKLLIFEFAVMIDDGISAGDEAERKSGGKGEHGEEEHLERGHAETG